MAKTTHQDISRQINKLISDAINDDVPLQLIIMELEIMKMLTFERLSMFVQQARMQDIEKMNKESANKIITPETPPTAAN